MNNEKTLSFSEQCIEQFETESARINQKAIQEAYETLATEEQKRAKNN